MSQLALAGPPRLLRLIVGGGRPDTGSAMRGLPIVLVSVLIPALMTSTHSTTSQH
jgi:hypothetical protein